MDKNRIAHAKNNANIYLGKGIKKPRFREGKIEHPILYAFCLMKDIKLSELAVMIGCRKEYPRKWISGAMIPNQDQVSKLVELLGVPESILFYKANQTLNRKKLSGSSDTYKNFKYNKIKYPILYYLIQMNGHTTKSFSEDYSLNYVILYKTIVGICKPTEELANQLYGLFGVHRDILFMRLSGDKINLPRLNHVQYPLVFALCYKNKMSLSDISSEIGVSTRRISDLISGKIEDNNLQSKIAKSLKANRATAFHIPNPKDLKYSGKTYVLNPEFMPLDSIKFPILYYMIGFYGLSISEFSIKFSIPSSYLTNLIKGSQLPTNGIFSKLSTILNVPDYILKM